MIIITTIQEINSDNYDKPGFYYNLFNNNNKITLIIKNNFTPVGNNYVELSMNGDVWLRADQITSRDSFFDYNGITAIRINPSPQSEDFLMQIAEGATPVTYRDRG